MTAGHISLGRRYELLMANAVRGIPPARREALLAAAIAWMESDACPTLTHEELFYLWGAMAGIQMKLYSEDLQTQWGGAILEKGLKEALKK